jgi:hypothetical protein
LSLRRWDRGVIGFELIGGFETERLMQSHGIAQGFDVLKHAESSHFQVDVLFVLRPFVLEGPEEPFGDGVVVALAGAVLCAWSSA